MNAEMLRLLTLISEETISLDTFQETISLNTFKQHTVEVFLNRHSLNSTIEFKFIMSTFILNNGEPLMELLIAMEAIFSRMISHVPPLQPLLLITEEL